MKFDIGMLKRRYHIVMPLKISARLILNSKKNEGSFNFNILYLFIFV